MINPDLYFCSGFAKNRVLKVLYFRLISSKFRNMLSRFFCDIIDYIENLDDCFCNLLCLISEAIFIRIRGCPGPEIWIANCPELCFHFKAFYIEKYFLFNLNIIKRLWKLKHYLVLIKLKPIISVLKSKQNITNIQTLKVESQNFLDLVLV